MKKKLLYIHHAYHNKTKSTLFLINLLKTQYEVEFFSFDPYHKKFSVESLKNKKFDVLVLFQIMPSIQDINNFIEYDHGVFFPMFDGVPQRKDLLWYEYKDFHIINFSRTLHEELTALGFDSHYFQYFPTPADNFNFGDDKSVFFWQRINQINIETLASVLVTDELKHIHLHKAVDPLQVFIEPSIKLAEKCSFSDWFEKKEELNTVIEQSALYFAPRILEGIGMSFLEAMAMGRCVIAPDKPTMSEYIVHNETGFLYDFEKPQKIKLGNIQQIQKNAYEYIKKGYQEWEKKKDTILDLLELPVQQSVKKKHFGNQLRILGFRIPFIEVKDFCYKKKYMLLKKIPLAKKLYITNGYKFYLFGLILFFTILSFSHKKKFLLFNKIPLFKILYKQNYRAFYLLNFILIFSVLDFTYKKKYYLFNLVPLLKIFQIRNCYKIFLFGFIPILTIKKDDE